MLREIYSHTFVKYVPLHGTKYNCISIVFLCISIVFQYNDYDQ